MTSYYLPVDYSSKLKLEVIKENMLSSIKNVLWNLVFYLG